MVPAKTLQPKITNFGLWDFKNFFIENAQPELDHISLLNPCQAPEVLIGKNSTRDKMPYCLKLETVRPNLV